MRRIVLALAGVVALVVVGCGGDHRAPVVHHVSPCPNGPLARPCGPHVKGFAVPPKNDRRLALPSLIGVATREMYDTIVVSTVPANPWAVGGYVPGGSWPDYPDVVRAFPQAHHLSIAPHASGTADCLDVEPQDATAPEAPGWVARMIALHHKIVCLYGSLSNIPTIKAYVARAGIALSRVLWWCAWYRYFPGLVSGCDAVQWTDHALGRNLDESTVRADFFGVPAPPADPYGKYPKAVRSFRVRRGIVRASEYNTVKTWDRAGCRKPARRRVCVTSADHLVLLLGRIDYLRFHRRDGRGHWHAVTRARNDVNELGSRAAGIRSRI